MKETKISGSEKMKLKEMEHKEARNKLALLKYRQQKNRELRCLEGFIKGFLDGKKFIDEIKENKK